MKLFDIKLRNAECKMRNAECGMQQLVLPTFSIHNSAFIILLLSLTITLLASCANDSFNKRVVIPEAEWRQENRIALDADIYDTISSYVFGIGLRHLENYRYSNLFVFLHIRMPNGNITHDTIECTLATPEGKWLGKSSGSMRDMVIPLNNNLKFPLSGQYHFEIEQAMREPILKGISDIGLFIEKQ